MLGETTESLVRPEACNGSNRKERPSSHEEVALAADGSKTISRLRSIAREVPQVPAEVPGDTAAARGPLLGVPQRGSFVASSRSSWSASSRSSWAGSSAQ
jgi:hypothetical protein